MADGLSGEGQAPAIILVEPQLGENIGAAARAMANFGLSDLRLVAPRDGWPNEKAQNAASGANGIIDAARVFATAEEAVADLRFVYATTARTRDLPKPVVGPEKAVANLRERVAAGDRVGVMFGREKWGLTNDEVALADALVTFPVNPAFASLNIAQSVLLVSYVWLASGLNGRLPTRAGLPEVDTRPAEKVHLMGFLKHLEAALGETAYFRSPEMKPTLVSNLHSVFQRAGMTRGELDVLHGVIDAFERQRKRDKGGVSKPVLVFDSGIGGLSVVRAIRAADPALSLVYVADDAAFPYGAWEEGALTERIVALMGELIAEHDPAAVVIACNTASTLVLPPLRARYSVPFVGTVPAVKPAAEQTRSGVVAVLATPGTMKRDYTRDLIRSFAQSCHVRLVGAPHLAALAEARMRGEPVDRDAVAGQIAPCFVEVEGRRTDIVVLACTHYPFLADVMAELALWPVGWLDPAPAIARRLLTVIGGAEVARGGQGSARFTSGKAPPVPLAAMLRAHGLASATPI